MIEPSESITDRVKWVEKVRKVEPNTPDAEAYSRQRGRSTGIALQIIGQAMITEGGWVDISDHIDKKTSHGMLRQRILCFIKKLQYEGFMTRIYKNKYQLRFQIKEGKDV